MADGGLEYLFGVVTADENGELATGVRALLVAAGEQEDIRPFFA